MSQQLIVKQQKLSNQTRKVGTLSQINFVKSITNQKKIKEIPIEEVGPSLAMVFVKVSNLAGIKDPISKINKQDIAEMIFSRFKSLSLDEIEYAFKLERYGVYEIKTKHFQLFNADYVSTILIKYKKWLQNLRISKNLKVESKLLLPEITEQQKSEIVVNGLKRCFQEYKQTGIFNGLGRVYLYDFLDKKGLMPTDLKVKYEVLTIAENRLKSKQITDPYERAKRKIGNYCLKTEVQNECKLISLQRFLDNYVDFSQILEKL